MEKVYRSKVDWWLAWIIVIGLIMIPVGAVALLVQPAQEGVPTVWIASGMLVMAAFIVWLCFSVYYTITATDLHVRAAIFRWRVPLEGIVEVYPTHNPLSSPALSLDRLRVNYRRPNGKTSWVMISPKGKAQFLEDLAQAAGLEKDGDRLVRRDRSDVTV